MKRYTVLTLPAVLDIFCSGGAREHLCADPIRIDRASACKGWFSISQYVLTESDFHDSGSLFWPFSVLTMMYIE